MQKLNIMTLAVVVTIMMISTASAQNPYAKPDQSWVSLTGTVASAGVDEFVLDYGTGLITVESDDWGWYADLATRLVPGERVTVYGQIDDDLFEGREIKASSVYVYDRSTYYSGLSGSAADYYLYSFPVVVPEGSWISMTGTVKEIDGREFTLDTGPAEMQVDTIMMAYNPLDDIGMQQIDPGDKISVSGQLDPGVFEELEIQAHSVVTLSKDKQEE